MIQRRAQLDRRWIRRMGWGNRVAGPGIERGTLSVCRG